MRVIKPSPGELVDRQTILELKIEYGLGNSEFAELQGEDKVQRTPRSLALSRVDRVVVDNPTGVNVRPFMDENELIIAYITKNWIPDIAMDESKIAAYDKLHDELLEVNHSLWKLEDQIRILRIAPDKFESAAAIRAAEVAFTIADQNDKRAELVKSINALWGIKSQEKLHKV